jgi:hypothetical protein
MFDGFIISPEAVRECSAYHDALPHCADAGAVAKKTKVAATTAESAAPKDLVFKVL